MPLVFNVTELSSLGYSVLVKWLVLLLCLVVFGSAADCQTFQNPVFRSQDPYVQYWHGNYYYSDSDGDRISIRKSDSLTSLGTQPATVIWTSPWTGWNGHAQIWAPEIHLVDGTWYIYYAADFATDGRHRLFILTGGADPLDGYSVANTGSPKGQLVESSEHWAIDPDVFYGPDHILYLTWSCTDDDVGRVASSLCLASMSDALHTSSSTVRISTPTEDWERRTGAIQEGPIGLTHDSMAYITYSASASWTTNDYSAGVLRNVSGDMLNPLAWEKHGPILDRHELTYGPGSLVFTESPDGTELWCLFHAYDRLDCLQWACRSIRMQQFAWDADDWPIIGTPVNPGLAIKKPSGDK